MDITKYAGTKIKYFREQKSWTQTDLADKLGIGKSAVANYEAGTRAPKQDILFALAKTFEVSINEFFPETVVKNKSNIGKIFEQLNQNRQQIVYNFAADQLDQQNSKIHDIDDYRQSHTINVYGSVSAGTGEYLGDGTPEPVTIEGPIPRFDFAVRVHGDSMQPTFDDGQIIFVNKVENADEVRNNQFVIAEINGEAFIKKLFVTADCIKLISLNRKYTDITIHDYDDYRIIGVVVI